MLKGFLEGSIAKGITSWVDGAVDIAQPVPNGPDCFRNTIITESINEDHHVVRCPCQNESQQDGKNGSGDFLLSSCHLSLLPNLTPGNAGKFPGNVSWTAV